MVINLTFLFFSAAIGMIQPAWLPPIKPIGIELLDKDLDNVFTAVVASRDRRFRWDKSTLLVPTSGPAYIPPDSPTPRLSYVKTAIPLLARVVAHCIILFYFPDP